MSFIAVHYVAKFILKYLSVPSIYTYPWESGYFSACMGFKVLHIFYNLIYCYFRKLWHWLQSSLSRVSGRVIPSAILWSGCQVFPLNGVGGFDVTQCCLNGFCWNGNTQNSKQNIQLYLIVQHGLIGHRISWKLKETRHIFPYFLLTYGLQCWMFILNVM